MVDRFLSTRVLQQGEPDAVWTVDFKGQFKMLNGRYCYPLTIQDGFSRRGYPFNSPNHYRLGLPPRI